MIDITFVEYGSVKGEYLSNAYEWTCVPRKGDIVALDKKVLCADSGYDLFVGVVKRVVWVVGSSQSSIFVEIRKINKKTVTKRSNKNNNKT